MVNLLKVHLLLSYYYYYFFSLQLNAPLQGKGRFFLLFFPALMRINPVDRPSIIKILDGEHCVRSITVEFLSGSSP